MKRLFDFIIAFIALLVLWPVFLLIAFLIKRDIGSPVFFRQMRPGKHGKIFQMVKFRTMINIQDFEGNFLPDSERMTIFCRFLSNFLTICG